MLLCRPANREAVAVRKGNIDEQQFNSSLLHRALRIPLSGYGKGRKALCAKVLLQREDNRRIVFDNEYLLHHMSAFQLAG